MGTAEIAAGSRKPNPARGSKPGERRGGRKKGTPNKLTGDVKAMVLAALKQAGGIDYLLKQAQTNPNAFMTLVGKVLPLTLSGDPNNPLVSVLERRIVHPKN